MSVSDSNVCLSLGGFQVKAHMSTTPANLQATAVMGSASSVNEAIAKHSWPQASSTVIIAHEQT